MLREGGSGPCNDVGVLCLGARRGETQERHTVAKHPTGIADARRTRGDAQARFDLDDQAFELTDAERDNAAHEGREHDVGDDIKMLECEVEQRGRLIIV